MQDDANVTMIQRVIVALGEKRGAGGCLVVISGDELGRKFPLSDNETMIGRSAANQICIEHASVSRSHALVLQTAEGMLLRDCGSTNGTFVNEQRIKESPLKDGDLIKFGSVVLKFLSEDNVEASYHDELYRLSTLDALTQLYNRRYFQEALDREVASARRYGRPISLVVFDVDHFKRCNDSFGHPAGDAVLREVARKLRERIRAADVASRTGGEEFSVILPDVEAQGAGRFAESLRQAIADTVVQHEHHRIQVTISLGVAQLGALPENSADLVRQADRRLYLAKNSGRNRVVLAG